MKTLRVCNQLFVSLVFILSINQSIAAEIVWREAELPDASNLDVHANVPFLNQSGHGASEGMYLHINHKLKPEETLSGYWVEYELTIPTTDTYHIWLASTPLSVGWASPYRISWDNGEEQDLSGLRPHGQPYGLGRQENYFHWTNAGHKPFTAGTHRLRIIADQPRANTTDNIRVFLDAIALTTDSNWRPQGNRPAGSPWSGLPKTDSPEEQKQLFRATMHAIQMKTYAPKLALTNEDWTEANAAEVLTKISARPLPDLNKRNRRQRRFGVHGMEKPFVQAGVNDADTDPAFELLARAGCEFLRSAESCWHRLGRAPAQFNYRELDHQIDRASKYGMQLMLTVGYPTAEFGKGKGNKLAACLPTHYELYRVYLRDLFAHLPIDTVHSIELANEVDAAHVWWVGDSTPQDYVNEAKLVREAMTNANWQDVPLWGFGATWSSLERDRDKGYGRAWVEKTFDAGVDKYFDGYTLHYTWSPAKWQFADWIRQERSSRGFADKPLSNSEESCYGHPGDIVKLFARDLFLQNLESVTYFLACDFQEKQNLLYSGLFDLNWQPKLRLLAFAAAVDAMRDRKLVGLANPDSGLEGYVLETIEEALVTDSTPDTTEVDTEINTPRYALVLWALDRNEGNMKTEQKVAEAIKVSGLQAIESITTWRLDPITYTEGELLVTNEPIIVYTNELPDWQLLTPEEWRSRKAAANVVGQDGGILPGQTLQR